VAVVLFVGGARDDQAGGHGAQQGRDLRHHAFADGQDRVGVHGTGQVHVLHQHADGQATQQVDDDDHDARDGVALDELHRAVQAAVQLAFHLQRAATAARFVLVDEAGAQVRIDGQLLARHGVQREAGRDLGHPLGAFGDDDELDHGDDQEHHQAHHEVAAGHQLAEGGNDVPTIGVQQDHARGGNGQRKPEQRGHQQHARKDRKLQRAGDVHGQQQQHQARSDVHRHQQVDDPDRQRQHHQRHDGDDASHQQQIAVAGQQSLAPVRRRTEVVAHAHRGLRSSLAAPRRRVWSWP
jgi:hypothetical protein